MIYFMVCINVCLSIGLLILVMGIGSMMKKQRRDTQILLEIDDTVRTRKQLREAHDKFNKKY